MIDKKLKAYRKRLIKDCDTLAREICYNMYDHKCIKPGCQSTQTMLNPHHVFTRELWHVRWDLNNLIPLHPGCHKFWAHKHPDEVYKFMEILLGPEEWSKLVLRKNTGKFKRSIEGLEFMKTVLEKRLEKL